MRNAKRLASLLLALVLVFALAVPAFAAETYSITINNSTTGHTYEAYQIFKGDLSDSTLSNIAWGSGVSEDGRSALGSARVKAEAIKTADDAKAFAKEVAKYLTATKVESIYDSTAGNYKISGLEAGYYLVKDKDSSVSGNDFYTDFILEVVKNVSVTPKGDIPESTKQIVEGNNKVDVNEASIGDTVNYEITGTLPTNIADYNTYYYVFTDTLSKGLTYKANSVKVTVNGTDLTSYFYVKATEYSETAGTTITIGIQDLLALNKLGNVSITKDSTIVVTYSATLNENAVIAGEGNPNDVVLDYSNDPNNSGKGTTTTPPENPTTPPTPTHPTGETPKDTVVTYTTELTILKNDENNQILAGAEFTLSGNGVNIVLVTTETFTAAVNGNYYLLKNGTYTTTAPTVGGETDNSADYASTTTKYSKTTTVVAKGNGKTENTVVGTVDPSTGLLTFTGLGAGTYTITESKTPAGYNTIEPITFTLTFNAETKTFSSSIPTVVIVGTDNKLDTTIVNQAGTLLPSTGGMGTTIFYVLGSVLVLAAVVLLVTKKRMNRG